MRELVDIRQLRHMLEASSLMLVDAWTKAFKEHGPTGIAPRGLGCHLADLADDETGEVRQTQAAIAPGLGTSRDVVCNNLKILKEAGWVKHEGRSYWLVIPENGVAEGHNRVAESNNDVVLSHTNVAESHKDVAQGNTKVAMRHNGVAESNAAQKKIKQKRSPHTPLKEKTKEKDSTPGAREGRGTKPPDPDHPMWRDLFHQHIIEMLQRYDVPVDTHDPRAITDKLEDHPRIKRSQYHRYLLNRVHNKINYVKSRSDSEKVMRQKMRRIPSWLAENDDIEGWIKHRGHANTPDNLNTSKTRITASARTNNQADADVVGDYYDEEAQQWVIQ